MKAQEIISLLNTSDERSDLEAKTGSSIDKSILVDILEHMHPLVKYFFI